MYTDCDETVWCETVPLIYAFDEVRQDWLERLDFSSDYQLTVSVLEHCPHDSVERSQSRVGMPPMVTFRQFR